MKSFGLFIIASSFWSDSNSLHPLCCYILARHYSSNLYSFHQDSMIYIISSINVLKDVYMSHLSTDTSKDGFDLDSWNSYCPELSCSRRRGDRYMVVRKKEYWDICLISLRNIYR